MLGAGPVLKVLDFIVSQFEISETVRQASQSAKNKKPAGSELVIWNASSSMIARTPVWRRALVANAGVRGRPIAPLVLSAQERAYLERQVRRHRVARSLSERCRAILRVRMACQASPWLPNSTFMNTPLASGAVHSFWGTTVRLA